MKTKELPLDIPKALTEIEAEGFNHWLLKNFDQAFLDARKGKRKTRDEHHFELNRFENLKNLRDAVVEKSYHPGSSITFVVFDPMVREIFAAPFRDRVIHHFLYNMQAGWWDSRFIYDSYSCRPGKGTLFGIKRVQEMMRQASKNGQQKAYIIKLDISGYFMSLPRKKLYESVKWGLDQQFKEYKNDPNGYRLYKTCTYLWKKVLFDDPVQKARKRGRLSDWNPEILPAKKSLFAQPPGKGIVIGNQTSQLVSNIYLDKLDRFIKFELGFKYYGRYVDDFIIIVPEKEYLTTKQSVPLIENFLKTELDLELHPKKRYFVPVSHGVEFLGARIYPHCIYPSNRLQKKINRAADGFNRDEKEIDTIISYLGLIKHYNADKFLDKLFDDYGWRR